MTLLMSTPLMSTPGKSNMADSKSNRGFRSPLALPRRFETKQDVWHLTQHAHAPMNVLCRPRFGLVRYTASELVWVCIEKNPAKATKNYRLKLPKSAISQPRIFRFRSNLLYFDSVTADTRSVSKSQRKTSHNKCPPFAKISVLQMKSWSPNPTAVLDFWTEARK